MGIFVDVVFQRHLKPQIRAAHVANMPEEASVEDVRDHHKKVEEAIAAGKQDIHSSEAYKSGLYSELHGERVLEIRDIQQKYSEDVDADGRKIHSFNEGKYSYLDALFTRQSETSANVIGHQISKVMHEADARDNVLSEGVDASNSPSHAAIVSSMWPRAKSTARKTVAHVGDSADFPVLHIEHPGIGPGGVDEETGLPRGNRGPDIFEIIGTDPQLKEEFEKAQANGEKRLYVHVTGHDCMPFGAATTAIPMEEVVGSDDPKMSSMYDFIGVAPIGGAMMLRFEVDSIEQFNEFIREGEDATTTIPRDKIQLLDVIAPRNIIADMADTLLHSVGAMRDSDLLSTIPISASTTITEWTPALVDAISEDLKFLGEVLRSDDKLVIEELYPQTDDPIEKTNAINRLRRLELAFDMGKNISKQRDALGEDVTAALGGHDHTEMIYFAEVLGDFTEIAQANELWRTRDWEIDPNEHAKLQGDDPKPDTPPQTDPTPEQTGDGFAAKYTADQRIKPTHYARPETKPDGTDAEAARLDPSRFENARRGDKTIAPRDEQTITPSSGSYAETAQKKALEQLMTPVSRA